MTDEEYKEAVRRVVFYSFKDISFNFDELTHGEKLIFGTKERFEAFLVRAGLRP